MASSDSVELYQPCSRGGGTAPFGFKTRRDIFRIARPFPRPKCPHRSPVYSVHSPILASRINDIVLVEKGFWKPFMIAATTFDFHLMEADRDQPRERRDERIASNAPLTSALVSVEIVARFRRPIPSNKATRATNAVFRDVSTAYVLRDRKQSFIARFPLFRSV